MLVEERAQNDVYGTGEYIIDRFQGLLWQEEQQEIRYVFN